ncbi:MAG: YdeI/OmpD-associated family protein [Pseudomonadota bacterium]
MTEEKAGLPILAFATGKALEAWMAKQPAAAKGLWLRLAKKGNGTPSVSRAEAIEAALCNGWIDGQIDKYDDQWWLVRMTRRTPRSPWSEINRKTALRLIDEGRMQAAGRAQVEAAQADGRWERAYAPQSTATVPPDLQAALDRSPAALRFFQTLTGANRYAILYRVHEAKTEKTRLQRVAKFIGMLERGEVVHPPKDKKAPQ